MVPVINNLVPRDQPNNIKESLTGCKRGGSFCSLKGARAHTRIGPRVLWIGIGGSIFFGVSLRAGRETFAQRRLKNRKRRTDPNPDTNITDPTNPDPDTLKYLGYPIRLRPSENSAPCDQTKNRSHFYEYSPSKSSESSEMLEVVWTTEV
ncbi:hypothetical protein YC2023_013630 [Brassica napus]